MLRRLAALALCTLAVVATMLATQIASAPPAFAQSAQLMQHYNKYQALQKAGKYSEAEFHAKKALELGEKEFGTKHRNVGTFLNNLAGLYEAQGRYLEAEPLYKRSLAIYEAALGKNHPLVATTLNNLAGLYERQGRYVEAEPLYKRSLAITEAALGKTHPSVATTLNNLAGLYRAQGRYGEAELLYKRSLAITEAALGKNHRHVGTSLNNLAALYIAQGRYGEAEPLYKRSLAIYEAALGKNHRHVGQSLNNLAALYKAQGRYGEAKPLYKRSLAIHEAALGKNHPDVATLLNNLALLYKAQGRYEAAESLYKQSLEIRKKALGSDHPDVGVSLNNLAWLYFTQSDWRQAATNWRMASEVLTRRAARGSTIGQGVTGEKKSEVAQRTWYFRNLVKAIYRNNRQADHAGETFESAQWAIGSQAAGALAQMSARHSAGSSELANMVRERQDSVRAWQKSEKRMNALRGAGKNDKKLQARMAGLDQRIAEIDKRLAKEFPDYAALASPKPLSVEQVQKLLGKEEALILLLDTPKIYSSSKETTPAETFIWAVTRDKAVWKRAELGGGDLSAKVALLRKELDPSTTTRSAQPKRGFASEQKDTGFSLKTAHELYTKLLGPVEELISDKSHLMIVASGPLTALPFQVLLKTAPKPNATYQQADWLIRHHAITTLPSVSSLKALRGIGKTATPAPNPLIGFADPVFQPASAKPVKVASLSPSKRAVTRSYQSFFKGRNADLATLAQSLPQLDGTRRELQEVGRVLKVDEKHLLYGRAASERAVKAAKLDQYRIVYFATHGLIAGDVKGLGEPALAFSLPAKATPQDDGLLTASEVTTLKLNAEWVVMSACNTAAGDKPGAQALSGLARAFFYAGAKTLLVSHWPVGDEAAVALTTHAFKTMQDNPKLGRAQALRQSMLAMIRQGGANAHPTSWAPFVIVGEGGAGK